ncbi:GGDEF domain-containing protein [Alteromonas sp. CYL-A6]|uniref:GGDEF domain-containing protein n=1 Tax=Alteromonas nitratireducens TaxID=3390813 RepID=UPI0034C3D7FD
MYSLIDDSHSSLFFVIILIAGTSSLAWLLMATPLRIYRTASLRFALTNLLVIAVILLAAARDYPFSYLSVLSLSALAVAVCCYELAIKRLYRIDDSYIPLMLQGVLVIIASALWLLTSMPKSAVLALLYAGSAAVMAHACVIKVRRITDDALPFAGIALSLPDMLITVMLATKSAVLFSHPSVANKFMAYESTNQGVIWTYIVLVLTLNATVFAASLTRILLRMRFFATHDQLTGLPNRRAVNERLEALWQAHEKEKKDFCILMIDVDYFKAINDNHGHSAGDAALQHVARLLESETGDSRHCGRFGGEEFIVILTDVSGQRAIRAANLLCERFRNTQINGLSEPLTVSIGCATSEGASSLDQMLTQADTALYQAKTSGRDKARLFNDPVHQSLSALS